MKFNVSSKKLYNYLASVSKIISAKNTMQILNNFLFILEDNQLTIKASDMENTLVGRLEVSDADGSGRFCLDARRIVELFKELPDQGITFEVDDENFEIKISYTNGCYNTVAINGLEYPDKAAGQAEDASVAFNCTGEQMMKGIENTLFAVGSDEIRPQMMGILWDVHPENIVFVATDTRRLVRYTNATSAPGCTCSFILPVKGATVLKNVFAKEETIAVTVSATAAVFESKNFTFECRLIKGNFPDYNRVIPQSMPYQLTVDRQSLLTSVRRVAVFGNEGGGLVKLHFHPEKLRLTASDNNFGTSGWETVPALYEGTEFMMGFSSVYLIEMLATFSTGEVIMKVIDRSRPALFTPAEDEANCELVMILMPMNIGE